MVCAIGRFRLGNFEQIRKLHLSTRVFNAAPIVQTRLTFFSKPDCQLCHEAKVVLDRAIGDLPENVKSKTKNVETIDITAKGNEDWFACYRYDIPVLHVEREGYKKVVFMHRFDYEELSEELGEEL